MKKYSRQFFIPVIAAMMAAGTLLTGCTGNNGEQKGSSTAPKTNPEISEKAMENFLNKLESGNYVMSAEGYLKSIVASEDMVYFDYEDNSAYKDLAVMSVNDEVFQGVLTDDSVTNVAFVKEGKALDAASKRLPNAWIDMADGNIFNLFYNNVEKPLEFVSNDTDLKNTVRAFAGYSQMAMNYMHEVNLILDAEDPTEVHIKAVVDDDEVARYYFDDIDITIVFGNAAPDSRVAAWMKTPTYPEGRTAWNEADLFVFNSVFFAGYGEKAVPFFPNASYALVVDGENFVKDDAVYIRDSHATKEDVENYYTVLEQNGFTKVTEDGKTYYRLLLRDEMKCYASISAEYNNGLDFTAKKWYEFPTYDGLAAINDVIAANNYPKLPETDVLTDFTAKDRKFEQIESWIYFYDYNTVLYVDAKYKSEEDAKAYLDSYAEGLMKDGYEPVYVDGGTEGEIDHYRSPDKTATYRYHFGDDGETVTILFKAEKPLSADEVQTIITGEGFPAIDKSAYDVGRDHTKFEKAMYGRTYKTALTIYMVFESSEAAEAFLNSYTATLEEQDFMRVPPSMLGSTKTVGYIHEEKGLGCAFDYVPNDNGEPAYVNFDFKSGIDFSKQEENTTKEPILGSLHAAELHASR